MSQSTYEERENHLCRGGGYLESTSASFFQEGVGTLPCARRRLWGHRKHPPWPDSGEGKSRRGEGTAHAGGRASADSCLICAIRES